MLPTFIVIGAQKSGTSSLWSYLGGHPQVYVAAEKEPKFFVAERELHRGIGWYESLFADSGGAKARGELSTDYSAFPVYGGVPARMASLVPDIRLIYVMRNPIDRIRSAYGYALWAGLEGRTIDEAVLYDARYLFQSQYALQIEQYLPHFPLSQFHFVKAEDLRFRRAQTLRAIFAFIGVDPDSMPANIDHELNVVEGRSQPRPWARRIGEGMIRLHADEWIPKRLGASIEAVANHRLARKPIIPEALVIGEDLQARLVGYLSRDLEALRGILGPGFDCWGLLDPPPPTGPSPPKATG